MDEKNQGGIITKMMTTRKTFKLVMATALACMMLCSILLMPITAATKQQKVTITQVDLHFVLDGKVYHTPADQQGFIYNDRTYVPIRFASYLFEKWVGWNQTTATVSVSEPTDNQLKQLQQKKDTYLAKGVDATKPASGSKKISVVASLDAANYIFFGTEKATPKDTTSILYKGTVYVPIRFFSESIKHDITYDSKTRSVIMTTKQSVVEDDKNQGSKPGTGTDAGTGTGTDTPAGGDIGGGVNPEVPTRESIVEATNKELKRLDTACSTNAYTLYEKYSSAADADKAKYLQEGYAMLGDCDSKVDSVLAKLDAELAKYDYEIGNDSTVFLSTYKAKKEALLAKFL